MSYPINDIFEGTADLLMKNGKVELSTHNLDELEADIYIKYGGYTYLIVYIGGVLHSITRGDKEVNHGQD